jgi:hypothetical protein
VTVALSGSPTSAPPRIRREDVALVGDVVDVDVKAPVLCVVAEGEVRNEIRRDRVTLVMSL